MNKISTLVPLLCILLTSNLWSQKFLTQGEIYNFNPGDEFHVLHYYCCNDLAFQVEQIIFTDKIHNENKLIYHYQKNVFDFLNSNPPQLIDTSCYHIMDTLIIEFPDSIIFVEGDEILNDPGLFNGRTSCTHFFWIFDIKGEEQYAEGLGFTFRSWKMPGAHPKTADSMIYFSKGSEKWGVTLLGDESKRANDLLKISPNPVKTKLFIQRNDPGLKILDIVLMDVNGRTIEVNLSNEMNFHDTKYIDCQNLYRGMYFIYLSTNKGRLNYTIIKD